MPIMGEARITGQQYKRALAMLIPMTLAHLLPQVDQNSKDDKTLEAALSFTGGLVAALMRSSNLSADEVMDELCIPRGNSLRDLLGRLIGEAEAMRESKPGA